MAWPGAVVQDATNHPGRTSPWPSRPIGLSPLDSFFHGTVARTWLRAAGVSRGDLPQHFGLSEMIGATR